MEISQAQMSRNRILGAATEVFRDKGAAGTSVDSLIRQLGIGKSQFYSHFPSKSSLVHAILQEQLNSLPHFDTKGINSVAALRDWVEAILDHAEDGLYLQGCPVINAIGQIPPADKLHTLLAEALKSWHCDLASRFQEMMASGRLLTRLSSTGLASATSAAVIGGFHLSKALQDMRGLEESLKTFLAFIERLVPGQSPEAVKGKPQRRDFRSPLTLRNCP